MHSTSSFLLKLTCVALLAVLTLFPLLEASSDSIAVDVERYMQDALADYQVKLHRASQTMQKRVRRDLNVADLTAPSKAVAHMSEVKKIIPWQSIPTSYPVELAPFKIKEDQYLAVVNFKNKDGGYRTNSAVYLMGVNQTFSLLQNFSTSGGIDFEYADLGTEQYAIFLDHIGQNWYGGTDKYTYMKSFQVNQFLPTEDKSRPFQYRTKVRALGAKKVKVFTKDNKHYFVTANSYHRVGDQYHVKSTMHVQTRYGYELIQEFITQGAQDVEVEVIGGKRFIFFVNQMDNAGRVDIYSTVYVENGNRAGRAPFSLYQRIGTHGARDFEYFTFSGNHYLAVANEYTQVKSMDATTGQPIVMNDYEINSVIYWWTGTMWVQWQLVPTQGAVKWSFFKSSFGDPMLVVANTKAPPVIFTYDPLRGLFKPTQVQGITPIPGKTNIVANVRSILPFTKDKETYLAVANYNPLYTAGYNVFKVTFETRPVPKLDPSIPEIIRAQLDKMTRELAQVQQTLIAMLLQLTGSTQTIGGNITTPEVQESLISLLQQVTNNVMRHKTDQNITAKVTLHNATIADTLSTKNFLYHQNKTRNPMRLLEDDVKMLKARLEGERDKLNDIQSRFDDAVMLHKGSTITGKKTFTDIHTGTLATNELTVHGLTDQSKLEELQQNTWSKSKVQNVSGNYFFITNLTVTDAQVKYLNGRTVNNMLTTNTQQTITSRKSFAGNFEISSDVSMSNFTVNGLKIPDDLVLSRGNQTITGLKNFSRLEIEKLKTHGLVDGVNVSRFHDNRMTLTSDQVMKTVAVLDAGFTTASGIAVGGLVDGVNLTAMKNARNMSDRVETISGEKTFKSIVVRGGLSASLVNSLDLHEAVTLNSSQVISAKMQFLSDVNISGNVFTNATVNDLDLSKDIVTMHGNQTIGGHKTFAVDRTTVIGNIKTGKVDGVDLVAWNRSVVTKYSKQPITGEKRFNGGAQVTNQLTANVINNVTLATVRDGLISVTGNGTTSKRNFNFETLTVDNFMVNGTLNGFRVPEDFVPLKKQGQIAGVKVFNNNVSVAGNISVTGKLSGKNFSFFYDNVLKNNTNESIYSDVHFSQPLQLNNINVTGKINNLSIPRDVVTTTTYQNISVTLSFTRDTKFENSIDSYIILVNDTVNGIDISEMEKQAIYKDRNQTINGSIIFVGGIDCKQNLSVAGLVNGVNLTKLMDTSVRVSRDQRVTGEKRFINDLVFRSVIRSPGTVNGVNISQLNRDILKKTGNQTVTSYININGDVDVTNTIHTKNTTRINNVNFDAFVKNAAKTNLHNIIKGDLTYAGGVTAKTLGAQLVDNVNVSNILLTTSNQTVTAHTHFNSLAVNNLTTAGLIDGIDIEQLQSNTFKLHGKQNITGKYVFRNDVKVLGNVSVIGTINDVNLEEFDRSAVHLTGSEIIGGRKYFRNLTLDDVNFIGLVNGVNVSLLFNDALRRNGIQNVCQKKTFVNSVSTTSDTSLGTVHVTNLTNGVNLTDLNRKAIKLSETAKALGGNYTFADRLHIIGNLTTKGAINGRNTNEFMTTFGSHNVTGHKTIAGMKINGNLNVTGLIDNVNITEMYGSRVSLKGDQVLTNQLHFKSAMMKSDIVLPNNATVNDIDVSESLVPVHGAVVIRGRKSFNRTYVRGHLNASTGVVNGVNLAQLASNAVKLSSPGTQIVSKDQRFVKGLNIVGNLDVAGTINGVRVTNMTNYSDNVGDEIKSNLMRLTAQAKALCNATTALMPAAASEHVLAGIEKVNVFKSFPVDGHLGSIHSTTIGSQVFISVARAPGSICGPAYILKCNHAMHCGIHQTIYTNAPTMEFFEYKVFNALFVAHWKTGLNNTVGFNPQGCKEDPEIFVFNPIKGLFMPYQTLNVALFVSEVAPVISSSAILAAYLGKAYGQYQRSQITPGSDSLASTKNPFERLPVEVKWFQRHGKSYLVVGGYDDNTNFVDILFINGTDVRSLKMQQRIKANGRYVSVGKLNNGQTVIATSADGPQGSIKTYIYNSRTNRFEFYQRLHHSATSVTLRQIRDKPYLMFASPDNGFGLCEWQGVSGYGACATLQTTDTMSIETIITSSGAFAVAGTDKSLIIYRTIFEGSNKPYERQIC